MSDYVWNRITPDICECGFPKDVHLKGKCPWDRDELVAMRRAITTVNRVKRGDPQR